MPITKSEAGESAFKKLTNQAIIADNASGNVSTGYGSIAAGIATTASGNYSFAGGSGSVATGYGSFSFGMSNTASATRTTAFGSGNIASADFSTALNRSNTASGVSSLAVGRENIASNAQSFASGYLCNASGDSSRASGRQSAASGPYSNAANYQTTASGTGSHAEGGSTIASSDYAHAEGSGTNASGSTSHAEGFNTTASGSSSHSGGKNAIASRWAEWARSNGLRGQYGVMSASAFSTNATPFILYLDESASKFTIPANKAYKVKLECVVINFTTGDAIEYEGKGLIKNLAGTTTLVGAFAMTSVNGDAGLAATAITVTADDVNDCLQIECTGIADSLDWFCKISYVAVDRL